MASSQSFLSFATSIILAAAMFAAPALSIAAEDASPASDIDDCVVSILAGRCLECHSGAKPEGGLDLSQQKLALDGGESGPALIPGKPDASRMWQRIAEGEMLPDDPLPKAERELIRSWISAGAKWGTDFIDPFRASTGRRAGYDWWSLQPLAKIEPKAVDDDRWSRNEIDRFVTAKLNSQAVKPSQPASPRVLIRRLSHRHFLNLNLTPHSVEGSRRYSATDALRNQDDRTTPIDPWDRQLADEDFFPVDEHRSCPLLQRDAVSDFDVRLFPSKIEWNPRRRRRGQTNPVFQHRVVRPHVRRWQQNHKEDDYGNRRGE